MKRLQISFDEQQYQLLREIASHQRTSISQIIREAVDMYLQSQQAVDSSSDDIFATSEQVEQATKESVEDFADVYQKLA